MGIEQTNLDKQLKILSLAVDQSSEGIAISDLDGNLEYLNNAFAEIHGYSAKDLVGKNISIFHTPEQMPSVEAANLELKQTGRFRGKIWHTRLDGTVFPAMMHNSIIRDNAGNPIGMMAALRNISDIKQTEGAPKKNHDKLEQRVEKRTAELIEVNEQLKQEIEERKRAEEVLHEQAQVLASIKDTIMIITPELKTIYANQTAKDLFGDRPEMFTEPCYRFFKKRDNPCENCPVLDVMEDEKPHQVIMKSFDKDGAEMWRFNTTYPYYDRNGRLVGGIEIVSDYTAQKKAEDELKTSEQRLTQIINFLPDATMVIDLKGKVIAWNQAIEKMTGVKAQEMLGKGDYEYAIPFYGERRPVLIDFVGKWDKEIEEKYQYVKKEGESLVSETYNPLVKPDGFLWNKASLLYDHNGEVIGAIESIRDITERKLAEEALRDSEEKFRNLTEITSDWIWEVDKNKIFTYVSPKINDILGYEPEEIIGKTPFDLMPSEETERVFNILNTFTSSQEPFYCLENTNIHKNGYPVVLESSGVPIFDAKGEFSGYRGIDREITNRKQAAEKLRIVSSRLLTAQERERKRISLELHDEIGQALVVLKLQLRSIQRRLKEGQTELMSDCQAMLDYMVGLIENIRRICKDLSPGILDDLGLTTGIRWLAENVLESHDIDTSEDVENIDKLLTNEQQLLVFRIFQEAFTNIVRHSRASLTSIAIKKQDGEISLVIEDNGKGFDVKEAMGRDFTERGMGLAAMEERAWMLGGSVNIWSQRESGTRIEFRIPIE